MQEQRFPIYRLTQDAYNQLLEVAEQNPQIYADPATDFHEVLQGRGLTDYVEDTGLYSTRPISLTPVAGGQPNRADCQALDFYNSIHDMTPSLANDALIWTWMTHFRLHSYSLKRWRRQSSNFTNHIKRHWFVAGQGGSALWDSNTASRTWWIAHVAKKAAHASGGAFTAAQALDHFAHSAEHYHTLMGTGSGFTWTPELLAEFVRVLLNEANGINRAGVRVLWRRVNLMAGVQLLDSLLRDALRKRMIEFADAVMSEPNYVNDRTKLRNSQPTVVLSLGAGVQSSCLALMSERGEYGLPKPDFAIFADTGWEPPEVYEHLAWLESELSFPVVKVQAGNIKSHILSGVNPEGRSFLDIPVFVRNADGSSGVATRQCTRVYKLDPIRKHLKERLQIQPKRRAEKATQVEMWLGISADESVRVKSSKDEWITNKYPLIENGFSRAQLLNWFNENYPGRYLPTSSCIGCPYHSDAVWKQLKEKAPDSFADAVFVDQALREIPTVRGAIRGEAYLHRSRKPLNQVDFSETTSYDEVMADECEGLCGI